MVYRYKAKHKWEYNWCIEYHGFNVNFKLLVFNLSRFLGEMCLASVFRCIDPGIKLRVPRPSVVFCRPKSIAKVMNLVYHLKKKKNIKKKTPDVLWIFSWFWDNGLINYGLMTSMKSTNPMGIWCSHSSFLSHPMEPWIQHISPGIFGPEGEKHI